MRGICCVGRRLGNAVMEHRTWRNWPYEQHLRVVDGMDPISRIQRQVEQVEQQFDFRQVTVSSPSVKIERLDMMMSARQWTTALRMTNPTTRACQGRGGNGVDGEERNSAGCPAWSDRRRKGFAYSLKNGPPTLVAIGSNGTWEKKGDTAVCNRWTVELKPGESATFDVDAHIGWTAMPTYRDSGPGTIATDEQATTDRRADREGYRRGVGGTRCQFPQQPMARPAKDLRSASGVICMAGCRGSQGLIPNGTACGLTPLI